ncbi:MAG: hypothetical protein GX537_08650 [Actinobacteria bacterium]|nr:hypothetical protein [Actinomycetota bacterium]
MTAYIDEDDDEAQIPEDVAEEIEEDIREEQRLLKEIEELEAQAELLRADRERRNRIFAQEPRPDDEQPRDGGRTNSS